MKTNYINTLTRSHINTLVFLFSFISLASNAQTDSIQYFDAMDRSAPAQHATYYRKMSKSDTGSIYLGVEYWVSGHLKMMGHSLDPDFMYKIGKFVYYYQNGNKSAEGDYYSNLTQHVFGYKNKRWDTWYLNGKPKEEWIYKVADDLTYTEGFLMSYWDKKGAELTVKGNGKYEYSERVTTKDSVPVILFTRKVHNGIFDSILYGYYSNGKEYSEELYHGEKLIKGKSFDGAGNVYSYDSVQTPPVFEGGETELNRFIKLNLITPPGAGSDILKNVVVRVFVGNNGFVGNATVIQGVNRAMDAEALRVARLLPRFSPSRVRGQPVDSYCVFPVSFNLP